MLANLFTGEAHHVELILIFIEVEHIAHVDRTSVDGGIELERSVEGNVSLGDFELQVEDEIIEGAASEERFTAVDGVLESTNLLAHILVDFCNLRLESLHEFLVNRTFCHIGKASYHFLVSHYILLLTVHLLLVEGQSNLCISYGEGVIGRVETNNRLAFHIGNSLVASGVVMAKEYYVETWHFLCNSERSILFIFRGNDSTVLTTMEDADYHVRLLVLLDVLHPFPGTGHHVLEMETAPEILCQPVRNGWSQQAEHGNLHTLAVQDDVRLDVRLASLGVDDVGSQNRAVQLLDPFVVNRMTGLNIMVTERLCIILHIVDHIRSHVASLGVHIIIIVAGGLSLQNVAILQEDNIVLIRLSKVVDVGRNSS